MGEPGDEGSDPGTALERYRALKRIALSSFPELVESARIERDPGDTPRNLRLFLRGGSFLDVWLSETKYSYHWQGDDRVVRFDNAPHHDTDTFPHHVHVDDEIRESPLRGTPTEDVKTVLHVLQKSWITS